MYIQVQNGKLPAIVAKTDFEKIVKDIFKFFKSKGADLKPLPQIVFDCGKQKSLVNFCLGFYNISGKKGATLQGGHMNCRKVFNENCKYIMEDLVGYVNTFCEICKYKRT